MMGVVPSTSIMMNFCFMSVMLLVLLPLGCDSATAVVVVYGVTQWRHPTAKIGDSIIFKHKDGYNLYIFRTKRAFVHCNFTQASLLKSPNSTFTWRPSRPGFFYFSFYNGTSIPCQQGQKYAVKVTAPQPSATPPTPQPFLAAPPPNPDGVVSSPPQYPWPFQPREKSGGSLAPGPGTGSSSLAFSPDNKGSFSTPFISSNPAVPLPSGEVDSATILTFPTTASNHAASQGVWLSLLIAVLITTLTNFCVLLEMEGFDVQCRQIGR